MDICHPWTMNIPDLRCHISGFSWAEWVRAVLCSVATPWYLTVWTAVSAGRCIVPACLLCFAPVTARSTADWAGRPTQFATFCIYTFWAPTHYNKAWWCFQFKRNLISENEGVGRWAWSWPGVGPWCAACRDIHCNFHVLFSFLFMWPHCGTMDHGTMPCHAELYAITRSAPRHPAPPSPSMAPFTRRFRYEFTLRDWPLAVIGTVRKYNRHYRAGNELSQSRTGRRFQL